MASAHVDKEIDNADVEIDAAELKRQRKAAKIAAKEAARKAAEEDAAPPEEVQPTEVDEEEARRQRKAAKKAAKMAAAAAAQQEQADTQKHEDGVKTPNKEAPSAGKAAKLESPVKVSQKRTVAEVEKSRDSTEEEVPEKKTKTEVEPSEAAKDAEPTPKRTAFTVYMTGIAPSIDEDAMRRDFAKCGDIKDVKVVRISKGKKPNFAFVTFQTQEGVDEALKLNNTEYNGHTLLCQKANVPKDKNAKGEKRKVEKVAVKASEEGKSVQSAKAEKRKVVENDTKRRKVDQNAKGEARAADEDALTLQIRGLPRSLDEILRKDFGRFGEIQQLEIKPHGVAVIKYKVQEGCVAASKFAPRDYLGRTIQISQGDVVERPENNKDKGDDVKDKKGKGKGKDGKGSKGKGKNGKDKREEKQDQTKKGKGKGGKSKGENLKNKGDGQDKKGKREEEGKRHEIEESASESKPITKDEETCTTVEAKATDNLPAIEQSANPVAESNEVKIEPVTDDE